MDLDAIVQLFSLPSTWISVLTLSVMEIVLGIDNVVFLSIITGNLPREKQKSARRIGLILAMGMRIGLLFALSWLMRLKDPLFTLPLLDRPMSGRDLILLGGGLFLIAKSTHEIFDKLEVEHDDKGPKASNLAWILVQVVILDIVFSLDSVITAVGMTPHLPVMIVAVLVSVGVMVIFAQPIGDFVNRHPSVKVLALSFLILIGVLLVGESLGKHIDKGYVYFAMAFSLGVELINLKLHKGRRKPVQLHSKFENAETPGPAE
jgi:predicted tellurium resistance membrane protein TerC